VAEQVETVIVGGSQAGLAMSYWLTQRGREHVILERGRIGERWRSERWDSLTLLGPNWLNGLPGFDYEGDDPDGFLPRDGMVRRLEAYAARYNAPMRCGVEVTSLQQKPGITRYLLQTGSGETLEAVNVVVATGPYQKATVRPSSSTLPPDVVQLSSTSYRNPAQLPPGGVLVIGSASSGCQICEDLHKNGRPVFLSVGLCQRNLRRYRGKDSTWWNYHMGSFDLSPEIAGAYEARYGVPAQITGVGGGHDLDYRRFEAEGVTLLGHLRGIEDGMPQFAPDLAETIRLWDESLANWKGHVDAYVEKAGIDAPPNDAPPLPGPEVRAAADPILQLDLRALGITSVIWANGFAYDFGWIKVPAFDGTGRPIHRCGVTAFPGLYFLGLKFLSKVKSPFIFGVGDDAAYLAEQIDAEAHAGQVGARGGGSWP